MPRALLLLVVLLVLVLGFLVWLGTHDHKVAPTRVEKEMLNDAAAH